MKSKTSQPSSRRSSSVSVYETDYEFGSTDSRQTIEFRLKTEHVMNGISYDGFLLRFNR